MPIMDVAETRLRVVLGGDQRYRVPLYQRPYSWSEKQLERLWTDLLEVNSEVQRNDKATHFTGSLVLDLGRAGPGVNEYLVVDGQQRLTTLSILLCAIRDHVAEHDADHPEKRELIHERYLVDKYKSGDERLKLLPTQADRDDYRALIDGTGAGSSNSRVTTAYRYFRLQLQLNDDPNDDLDIDRILESALGALAFISITARGDDNVYRIFESLNNTGMKLTQGDLLRNYVFMRLGSRGEEVYSAWWLPMQDRLTASDLETLFWMDLVATNSEAKQGDIYSAQQDRMDKLSTDEVLSEIKRFAHLSQLLQIMREPQRDDRFGPVVQLRLERLLAWGATAADPLVLRLLAVADSGELSKEALESCLATLESFLVRRLLVGASTGGLTRILFRAPSDMRSDVPVPEALMLYFSTGRKFFGSDEQVLEAALGKPLYYMGRPHQKKLLLQWLEESYGSKEPVDLTRTTIEHVLPQTLTPFWRDELARDAGPDEPAESIHEALEHTLGNLTLTAYNSELSNRDYPEKRALLLESGIRLNAAIASKETWGRPEILERGRELSRRITDYWVAPVQVSDVVDSGSTWALVGDAIDAIPAGSWTTYGDLAALASTYPQPVAGFVTRTPIHGAWRVLQAGGTVSPGFSWGSRSEFASKSAQEVLASEGVRFDSDGKADPEQRLSALALAQMLGIEIDLERENDTPTDDDEGPGFEKFIDQLTDSQPASAVHGMLDLIGSWRAMGGHLGFGVQSETSCFFMARRGRRDLSGTGIWPFTVYPRAGTVEVVFQYLKDRPPFDRLDLRQELRTRLNRIDGIDIPEDRLTRRPSFKVSVLESDTDRASVIEVLRSFMDEVQNAG
jgi:alkylated DNA nucleotide flippase Atl1